jgi:hypothetical protein
MGTAKICYGLNKKTPEKGYGNKRIRPNKNGRIFATALKMMDKNMQRPK